MMSADGNGWLLDVANGNPSCRSVIGSTSVKTPLGVPLDLYLEVDSKFLAANFPVAPASMSLFYTFQSNICFESFQYKLSSSENSISFVSNFDSEEAFHDFDDDVDRTPREIFYGCTKVSDDLAMLNAKLNSGKMLSDQESKRFGEQTYRFADVAVGGYPYVDVTSQIFGETFLNQRPDQPQCRVCHRQMMFFAAIRRDSRLGTTFIPDGAHVVAHYCSRCYVVDATHFL